MRKYKAQANDIEEARALYRKEMLQRKMLYNEVSFHYCAHCVCVCVCVCVYVCVCSYVCMSVLMYLLYIPQVQELRGNIRVFCRCRRDDTGPCTPKFQDDDKVIVTTHQGRLKSYEFEKIFPPDTTQEQVDALKYI